ncbi:ABC transporter permease subunit [Bacillus suaedaesalsae]|uniref:ABC transporter permease subunit n=1 Tax=Bacillus suaedaesalsae TaxID=2810349 RepID=A0ABS2DK73_9BACI|nr:ABC transporter permease subunit [Bacillus suaedaesalsae]MBM6618902.1 ABC transporter permease subunit [Bacillus suaedaesalsae]
MIMYFLRKPKFIVSFLFVTILLTASFLYEPFFGDKEWPTGVMYDEQNNVIGAPPFTPLEYPPMGSDRFGMPLLAQVIQGAKYTVITAFVISTLQVLIAFILSIFYTQLPRFLRRTFEGIVESSLFIPASIIAYIILFPLQFYIDPNLSSENFYKLFIVQVIILTLLGIPQLVTLFSKEIQRELQQEYILASRTLGAKGLNLYRKHILPFMLPRLILQFSQRTVEILILFVHLGFLAVFLGGYVMKEVFDGEFQAFSLSYEWAGEIGKHFRSLSITPWQIYSPLLLFALTVLSFNMIAKSIQEFINAVDLRRDTKKKKFVKNTHNDTKSTENPFKLIKKSANF